MRARARSVCGLGSTVSCWQSCASMAAAVCGQLPLHAALESGLVLPFLAALESGLVLPLHAALESGLVRAIRPKHV